MDETGEGTRLLRCGDCGNLAVGEGEVRCCDGAMRPVPGEASPGVDEPTLEGLLRTVFGVSEAGLDVCLCVMAGGERTAAGLAEETDYDRTVVSRHLNHLAALGVLEKRRRLLQQGGDVYVYSPNDPDVVRRSFQRGFVRWAARATDLLADLGREKVEAIVDRETERPQWQVFQE